MTQLGFDANGNCKFDLRWTCGAITYSVAGACSGTYGFSGTCNSTVAPMGVVVHVPMCSCASADGLAVQGAMLCGFPPPGP
jgi:hypothetical protein